MEIEREDIDYMMANGVKGYLKERIGSLDAPVLFSNFYNKLKIFLVGMGKVITTFFILGKVFDSIGTEKFIILLLSVYIANSYLKAGRRIS